MLWLFSMGIKPYLCTLTVAFLQLIKNAINQFPDPKNIGLDTLFVFVALLVWKIPEMAAILDYGKFRLLAVSRLMYIFYPG